MTTKQIELRTEIARKRIVMERLSLPGDRSDRFAGAAVVVVGCVGFAALMLLIAAVVGVR